MPEISETGQNPEKYFLIIQKSVRFLRDRERYH